MRYSNFEAIMSPNRMGSFLTAYGGDTRKAMTLYRKNLKLSQELFTVVSCLEIAMRNKIDSIYQNINGPEWLRNAAVAG